MDDLITDRCRIQWLQEQNNKARYSGRCAFRWSKTNRGWRLHETSLGGHRSVRDAIDEAMGAK